MKRLSVKQRMVLWSAGTLLLMTILLFLLLQLSRHRQAEIYARETLYRAAEEAMDEIELDDGELELDDDLDDIDYASVMVFDASGRVMLYGRVPDFDAPLLANTIQTAQGDTGSDWYVYDRLYTLSPELQVWVRVCLNMDSVRMLEDQTWSLFLWMMLPMLLLSLFVGYRLTRRAFRPIGQMAAAVQGIVDGADLSQRTGIQSQDEFGRLSQAIDDMLARLEQAFAQEKRFTSDVSHELRTPLTVILTQCELGLREEDPEQQRQSLEAIKTQADKLSRLVRELLTLSRMDANTQPLHREQVDLGEIMKLVAEELQGSAQEKGISIETDLQPGCCLMADEMLMMRLMINLVSNAIQFGKPGGYVRLSLAREEGWLCGSVEDNGIGIASEDLPHIWERFWQADSSRTGDNGSSGLGLAMVQWIIHAHKGTIQVESTLGQGTSFLFRLPLEE